MTAVRLSVTATFNLAPACTKAAQWIKVDGQAQPLLDCVLGVEEGIGKHSCNTITLLMFCFVTIVTMCDKTSWYIVA